ncbi:TIGR02301 family protein [Terricaulis sp.]|uniref:TIGR02301 family protein n=1 Tax=Terricaulis sp. TaxID=2768686 RepID=UPI0037841853
MPFRRIAIALSMALFAAATPALAQRGAVEQQADPAASGEQWYQQQLVDLAEVLGGSHYLRVLCHGRDDQRWRNAMRGVIQREPEYNNLLVDAFNRGYRQEEARYSDCDATAAQSEAELRARGLRISQALSARHAE